MEKNIKRNLKVAAVALLVLVVVIVVGGSVTANRYSHVRELIIEDQDISSVLNGDYYGAYAYGGFTYEVEVSVRAFQLTDIKILSNRTSKYARIAEGVVQRVLDRGNVNVDVVSGATTTSKALLKAIEQALACNL